MLPICCMQLAESKAELNATRQSVEGLVQGLDTFFVLLNTTLVFMMQVRANLRTKGSAPARRDGSNGLQRSHGVRARGRCRCPARSPTSDTAPARGSARCGDQGVPAQMRWAF